MLSFTGSLNVFVAIEPCDMRKGLVGERLAEDPRNGALHVFINRRHTPTQNSLLDREPGWEKPRPPLRRRPFPSSKNLKLLLPERDVFEA